MSPRKAKSAPAILSGAMLLLATACSGSPEMPEQQAGAYKLGQPYQISGRWYHPSFDPAYDHVGIASWYGDEFQGLPTANGEVFDKALLTAAHPTMPLPSIVRVTNLANERALDLRVNDRGPFIGDRLIDLSQAAAQELGFEQQGTTPGRVQFLRLAPASGEPPRPSLPPAPAPPPSLPDVQLVASAEAAECAAGGRFIQVGAFSERPRAERVARQLEAALSAPVATHPPTDDHLVRVRLGPLSQQRDVALALDRLSEIGYASAFVVRSQDGSWQTC